MENWQNLHYLQFIGYQESGPQITEMYIDLYNKHQYTNHFELHVIQTILYCMLIEHLWIITLKEEKVAGRKCRKSCEIFFATFKQIDAGIKSRQSLKRKVSRILSHVKQKFGDEDGNRSQIFWITYKLKSLRKKYDKKNIFSKKLKVAGI